MTDDDGYSDAEVQRAIDDLRAGGDPLPVEVIGAMSERHHGAYLDAIEREHLANAVRMHESWWTGPVGLPIPPSGIWTWVQAAPDDPRELTD